MELTDSEIMTRSPAEPELFVQVFDRHGRAVHAYLARRVGVHTADDLLGDVWLQAFRSRDRFDARWASARPWLFGIARNALRAHWRSTYRDAQRPEPSPGDTWGDVDVRLDAARRLPALHAALAMLPDAELEVLLLVAWEELSRPRPPPPSASPRGPLAGGSTGRAARCGGVSARQATSRRQ